MARRRKIQGQVEDLLERFHLFTPPIDVEKIAEDLKIELQKADLGDISGLVFREGNKVIIGVNESHPSTRQRFTIAHELGHFFLHSQNPLFVDKVFAVKLRDHVSSEAVSLEEVEANAFAAELLMPTNMIFNDIKQISGLFDFDTDNIDNETGNLDKLINELSDRYKVSKQAMTFRLINIGLLQNSV